MHQPRLAALITTTLTGVALFLATPAYAAQGRLVFNGRTINNPSGCYNAQQDYVSINNLTDEFAWVYSAPNCQGDFLGLAKNGEVGWFPNGRSVRIR